MLSFFFSSRRRHTRCGRDWSSDVCSSDLSGWPTGCRAGGATSAWCPRQSRKSPALRTRAAVRHRSEEHTSELQSRPHLVCRLLLEKKKTYYHERCWYLGRFHLRSDFWVIS